MHGGIKSVEIGEKNLATEAKRTITKKIKKQKLLNGTQSKSFGSKLTFIDAVKCQTRSHSLGTSHLGKKKLIVPMKVVILTLIGSHSFHSPSRDQIIHY